MSQFKDILLVLVLLLVIAAAFYAFQLVILLIVGYIVYISLPYLRVGNKHIRNHKWK